MAQIKDRALKAQCATPSLFLEYLAKEKRAACDTCALLAKFVHHFESFPFRAVLELVNE